MFTNQSGTCVDCLQDYDVEEADDVERCVECQRIAYDGEEPCECQVWYGMKHNIPLEDNLEFDEDPECPGLGMFTLTCRKCQKDEEDLHL